jgi:hypothetical protein
MPSGVPVDMFDRGKQIFESLVLRSGPGFVNLFVMLCAADWLGVEQYGVFSSVIATSGALASMLFGPLTFSVVSSYSAFAAKGEENEYAGQHASAVSLLALALLSVVIPISLFGVIHWSWMAPTVSFGVYAAFQELHHARLKFVRFAAVSAMQSLAFLVLAWSVVRESPSVNSLLAVYAISYSIGAFFSVLLADNLKFSVPSLAFLSSPVRVGTSITLSTMAADGFVVGFRYILVFFGDARLLGIFSFCLDIAQRLIGVVVNAATFALVPVAFKVGVAGDLRGFKRVLRQGAGLSLVVAAVLIFMVFIFRWLKLVPALDSDLFEPVAFVILSMAVVVNRVGKMVITPMAIWVGRSVSILYGYLVAGPVALLLGSLAIFSGIWHLVYLAFLFGFLLWALCSALFVFVAGSASGAASKGSNSQI